MDLVVVPGGVGCERAVPLRPPAVRQGFGGSRATVNYRNIYGVGAAGEYKFFGE